MAADLLCVVLIAELVVGCLTSGTESLVKAELLPETMDGLLSMAIAALTVGLTDVALTVATAVAAPQVSLSTTSDRVAPTELLLCGGDCLKTGDSLDELHTIII